MPDIDIVCLCLSIRVRVSANCRLETRANLMVDDGDCDDGDRLAQCLYLAQFQKVQCNL